MSSSPVLAGRISATPDTVRVVAALAKLRAMQRERRRLEAQAEMAAWYATHPVAAAVLGVVSNDNREAGHDSRR